jgi:glycosyltransferase involved in cell wall biosynthesis
MGSGKKVVIISPYQLALFRGIETFTSGLAKQLASSGVETIVYTWQSSRNASEKESLADSGVRVRTVPSARYYMRLIASVFYNAWLLRDKPSKVILNFLYHGEEKLWRGIEYYYVLHSPPNQIPDRYRFIKNQSHKFSRMRFIAVSEMVKAGARRVMPGADIITIYNGVDMDRFRPRPKGTNGGTRKLKLISVSAFEKRKRLDLMIKVIANSRKRQDIRYDIYGEGEERLNLENLIKKFGLEGIVSLRRPTENMENILPNYDLFCLLAKGESFCIAGLEALACDVPVFLSTDEPFPEIFGEEVGSLVNPDDLGGMVQELEKYFVERFRRGKEENSRKHAERFSLDRQREAYLRVLFGPE